MFKSASLRFIACGLAVLALSACSGGGGGRTGAQAPAEEAPQGQVLTGQFFAGNVQGLTVVSEDLTSTTDAAGTFQYREGSDVSFRIGGIELGTAKGAAVVTPTAFSKGAPQLTGQVYNVVQFLTTLDADGDPSNGIVILPEVTKAAQSMSVTFDTATDKFAANSTTQYAVSVLAPLAGQPAQLATQMKSMTAYQLALAKLLDGTKSVQINSASPIEIVFANGNPVSVQGKLPNDLPATSVSGFDATGRLTINCPMHHQDECYGLEATDFNGETISGIAYDMVSGDAWNWVTSAK